MTDFIDKADRRLLAMLQSNANASVNALAEYSHMSTASVQRRVKRLKDKGYLGQCYFQLDPKRLNKGMTFIVNVEMEREQTDQLDQFKKLAFNDPNVQQCYYVTGEADFVLICLAEDMEEFEDITKRLFFKNNNVRRFTTNVVMSKPKITLNVPIEVD